MTVYVDDARHPFGRYLMCHMWADTLDELLAMVDRIGVQRKWLQQPPKASWVHFDIVQAKRALAIKAGAVETDKYGPSEFTARLRGDTKMLARISEIRSRNAPVALAAHPTMDGMADPRAPDCPGQGRAAGAPPSAVARSAGLDADIPGRRLAAKPSMARAAPEGAVPCGEKVRFPTRFAHTDGGAT